MKYIQFIWPKRGCIKYNTSISQCKMLKANTSTNKGQPLTHPEDMYNVMVSYRKNKTKKNMNSRVGGREIFCIQRVSNIQTMYIYN